MEPLNRAAGWLNKSLTTPLVGWVALLGLCAPYIQGGVDKSLNYGSAVQEMRSFGIPAPGLVAVAVIITELAGSLLVVTGIYRWCGAVLLAGFTVFANLIANQFWNAPPFAREMMENGFFEHLGLVGGFVYVAWHDMRMRR